MRLETNKTLNQELKENNSQYINKTQQEKIHQRKLLKKSS